MSLTPGVYLISNKASGTVVDLGQLAQGTKIHAWASAQQLTYFFNQLWLIEQVVGQPYYTVRNLRSNLFLDLYLGSALNGTDLVGWNFNGSAAQQWDIKGNSQAGYVFKNRAAGTVMDLWGGNAANGTAIQGYGGHGGNNQSWNLTSHSRASGQIDSLLQASLHIGANFNHYASDPLYVTLPRDVISSIWTNKGLGSKKWRSQSYDSDDFAFAMKAAISEWVYDNIRAPVGVAFGIMYGNSANGAHAYNWYPTQDFSSIVIFEPQNGQAQATSAYKAYFGIY